MITDKYICDAINDLMDEDCLSGREIEILSHLMNIYHRLKDYCCDDSIDEESAEFWVSKMINDDGTSGAHWSKAQTEEVKSKMGYSYDADCFYVTMNMMYSDYGKVIRKRGLPEAEVCAELASSFLSDTDARNNKLILYEKYIVA